MLQLDRIVNVAAYQFARLTDLEQHRQTLRSEGKRLGIKGTVLLSPEGINLFLSGRHEPIEEFMQTIRSIAGLESLADKRSLSDEVEFRRFLVKIKAEIIAFGIDQIDPATHTSPRLAAQELRAWLAEGRPVHLLDVRNDYEIEIGTFDNARAIGVDHFRDFPAAVAKLPEAWRSEPIVTFCTGGIRCEKAAPLMEQMGFQQVYQLDGGILKYFEEVGGEHWQGECFVFDQRVSVRPDLAPGNLVACFACQAILTPAETTSPLYVPARSCPRCWKSVEEQMQSTLVERKAAWDQLTDPLPGAEPYVQRRPLKVGLMHAGWKLIDFLSSLSTPLDREQWEQECAAGWVVKEDQPLSANEIVQPGEPLAHLSPIAGEPVMSRDIEFLYEDDDWIVINKPAPLAVHPSGRYCRHSLTWLLAEVYAPDRPRPAHRLDVHTTGVMVFTRNRLAASRTQRQFENGSLQKVYLAWVQGNPSWDEYRHEGAVARRSDEGKRALDPEGQAAITEFTVVERRPDGTAIVEARPLTGRTNQIRLHLADLGHPIVGDPWYGSNSMPRLVEPETQMGLHAWKLSLLHPKGRAMEFTAERPAWWGV